MRPSLLFWVLPLLLALACSLQSPSASVTSNAGAQPSPTARTSAPPSPAAPAAPAASAPAAAVQTPTRLRVAVLTNSAQDGPVYFADERGYFQEQNLEVEVVKFATATEIVPFLAQGQLDVGAGGTGAALFNAIASGLEIRIVADKGYAGPNTSPAWLARADIVDQLRTPADLRGRVLGLGNQGSSPWVELDVMLQQGGLTLDDVEIKTVGYTDQVVAFANRSIDLAYNFEPNLTNIMRAGLASWWKGSNDIIPNHEGSVVLYGTNLVKTPEVGGRYMVGWLKGVRDYERQLRAQRDDAIIVIMTNNTDIKDPAAWKEMRLPAINPDGHVFPESLTLGQDYYIKSGQQQRRADLAQAIDSQPVEYALQQLGRYRP